VYASGGRRGIAKVESSWDGAWCLFYMLEVASSWHCGAAFPPPARAAEARVSAVLQLPACMVGGGAWARRQVDTGFAGCMSLVARRFICRLSVGSAQCDALRAVHGGLIRVAVS
jgi:hypothetical protein